MKLRLEPTTLYADLLRLFQFKGGNALQLCCLQDQQRVRANKSYAVAPLPQNTDFWALGRTVKEGKIRIGSCRAQPMQRFWCLRS